MSAMLCTQRAKSQSARRRGTVSVEYALVIASVVGVLLISVSILGSRIRHSLETASAFRPVANTLNASPDSQTTAQARVTPAAPVSAISAWIVIGQTAAMLSIISWVLLERRKRLRQLDEENAVAEPVFTEDKGRRVFAKRQQIFKILTNNMEALLGSQVQVRHLMSDRVTTVEPRLSANEVRDMMHEKHIRHLLVADRHANLVGIISDRDLRNERAATAAELMTPDPVRVDADSLVNPAITQMMKRRISALPVVSEGKVVGVLTSTDLMMALQCCLQVLQSVADQVRTPPLDAAVSTPAVPLALGDASNPLPLEV